MSIIYELFDGNGIYDPALAPVGGEVRCGVAGAVAGVTYNDRRKFVNRMTDGVNTSNPKLYQQDSGGPTGYAPVRHLYVPDASALHGYVFRIRTPPAGGQHGNRYQFKAATPALSIGSSGVVERWETYVLKWGTDFKLAEIKSGGHYFGSHGPSHRFTNTVNGPYMNTEAGIPAGRYYEVVNNTGSVMTEAQILAAPSYADLGAVNLGAYELWEKRIGYSRTSSGYVYIYRNGTLIDEFHGITVVSVGGTIDMRHGSYYGDLISGNRTIDLAHWAIATTRAEAAPPDVDAPPPDPPPVEYPVNDYPQGGEGPLPPWQWSSAYNANAVGELWLPHSNTDFTVHGVTVGDDPVGVMDPDTSAIRKVLRLKAVQSTHGRPNVNGFSPYVRSDLRGYGDIDDGDFMWILSEIYVPLSFPTVPVDMPFWVARTDIFGPPYSGNSPSMWAIKRNASGSGNDLCWVSGGDLPANGVSICRIPFTKGVWHVIARLVKATSSILTGWSEVYHSYRMPDGVMIGPMTIQPLIPGNGMTLVNSDTRRNYAAFAAVYGGAPGSLNGLDNNHFEIKNQFSFGSYVPDVQTLYHANVKIIDGTATLAEVDPFYTGSV